jgi:hypothetical protein
VAPDLGFEPRVLAFRLLFAQRFDVNFAGIAGGHGG